MDSIKKIAILISNLEREAADQLLDKLPEATANLIRNAIFELEPVSVHLEQETMLDFLKSNQVGLGDDEVPSPTESKGQPSPVDDEAAPSSSLIHRASDSLIGRLLRNEQPQTVAVVLSKLPASRASDIVATFSPALQAMVLQRLVELDKNSPPCPEIVHREIDEWLEKEIQAGLERTQLIARMASVVESASDETRQQILNNVAEYDAILANDLRDRIGIDLNSVKLEISARDAT